MLAVTRLEIGRNGRAKNSLTIPSALDLLGARSRLLRPHTTAKEDHHLKDEG